VQSDRKDQLVLDALENRDVSQKPEVRLQGEESQLRTASRLTNLIAIFCILAWRVFWLTEINRSAP